MRELLRGWKNEIQTGQRKIPSPGKYCVGNKGRKENGRKEAGEVTNLNSVSRKYVFSFLGSVIPILAMLCVISSAEKLSPLQPVTLS